MKVRLQGLQVMLMVGGGYVKEEENKWDGEEGGWGI